MTQQLLDAVAAVRDYTVVLTKQQRLGKDLGELQTLLLKHRRDPECRYLVWKDGAHAGREALHCKGQRDGKMLVHDNGLFGFFNLELDPNGKRAQKDDLRSIAETGIDVLAELMRTDADYWRNAPEPQWQIELHTVHEQPATCLVAPGGTPIATRYAAGRRAVCLYDDGHLPASSQIWNEAGELMESYTFRDYKVNPGLTDADFDPKNPEYDF